MLAGTQDLSSALDIYKILHSVLDGLPNHERLSVDTISLNMATVEHQKLIIRIGRMGKAIKSRLRKLATTPKNPKSLHHRHDPMLSDIPVLGGSKPLPGDCINLPTSHAQEEFMTTGYALVPLRRAEGIDLMTLDNEHSGSSSSEGTFAAAVDAQTGAVLQCTANNALTSNDLYATPSAMSSPASDQGSKTSTKEAHIVKPVESVETIADKFGDDSELELFEIAIDNIGPYVHWTGEAWSPIQLLTAPRVHALQYIREIPRIVKEVHDNGITERVAKLRKRIGLAHFAQAYQDAQDDPTTFVNWAQQWLNGAGAPPAFRVSRQDSIVKQLFSDILVQRIGGNSRKMQNLTHDWHHQGQRWASLISRLGYGILLLVPEQLTNTKFSKMPLDSAWRLIDAVEARRPKYHNALEKADIMIAKLFQDAASLNLPLAAGDTAYVRSLADTIDPRVLHKDVDFDLYLRDSS